MSTTRSSRRTTSLVSALAAGATLVAGLALSPAHAQGDDLRKAPTAATHLPTSKGRLTKPAKSRLLWKFRIEADYALSHPVVAPDGTIYLNDSRSHLYAITPAGKQKWRLDSAGDAGVALGPDGTIYVGSSGFITAVNPDGTIKWRFEQDPMAFTLLGPSVGPDGNIYSVASSGLGVFSLTPDGDLRWARPEPYDRLIVENQDLAFGPAPGHGIQLYFHANEHFRALRLANGKSTFTVNGDGRGSCGDGSQPVVGPSGNVYTSNWQIGEGEKLGSYDPSGRRQWTFVQQPNNCNSAADVGPDGKIYVVWNLSRLFGLTPAGKSTELAVDTDNVLQHPSVSPKGDQVVITGLDIVTHDGIVESFASRSGAPLWSVGIPPENGAAQHPMSAFKAPFSLDGERVYVTTIISGVYDHCFLYAVDARR